MVTEGVMLVLNSTKFYTAQEGLSMSLFLLFTSRVCNNVTAVNTACAVETLVISGIDAE